MKGSNILLPKTIAMCLLAAAMPAPISAQGDPGCTVCEDNYNMYIHQVVDAWFAIWGTGDPSHDWQGGLCDFHHTGRVSCLTGEEDSDEMLAILNDLDGHDPGVVIRLLQTSDLLSFNDQRGVIQLKSCTSEDIVGQFHMSPDYISELRSRLTEAQ